MFVAQNSWRAWLIALLPVAIVHIVSTLLGVIPAPGPMSTFSQSLGQPASPLMLPTSNQVILLVAAEVILTGSLFFAFHLVMRSQRVANRPAYAFAGAAAGALSYVAFLSGGWITSPPSAGNEIAGGFLPCLAGLLAGFLYLQLAGFQVVGDTALPLAASEAEPGVRVPTIRRFRGPVRVRTSASALLLAAIVPAGVCALLSFGIFGLVLLPSGKPQSTLLMLAFPAQIFFSTLLMTGLPGIILVLVTHLAVRAMGKTSGFAYAIGGGVIGAILSLVFAGLSPLTSFILFFGFVAIFGAMMSALYRRFAGLEAVPLPEPLVVSDESALVEADHPSRRGHVVVAN